jgi:hypothetical protein
LKTAFVGALSLSFSSGSAIEQMNNVVSDHRTENLPISFENLPISFSTAAPAEYASGCNNQ